MRAFRASSVLSVQLLVACYDALLFITALAYVFARFTGGVTIIDARPLNVDGATARVRLFLIDAPERGQSCTDTAALSGIL